MNDLIYPPVSLCEAGVHLERDGFTAISNVLAVDQLEEARHLLNSLLQRSKKMPPPIRRDLGLLSVNTGVEDTIQIGPLQRLLPSFERLKLVNTVFGIAEHLLGAKPLLIYASLIVKKARTGGITPWHQDAAFDNSRLEPEMSQSCLSVWIPLSDVKLDGGCLQYIPGSHRTGMRSHRLAAFSASLVTDLNPYDVPIVTCPLKAGSLLVHHRRTLHAAKANKSPSDRLAITLNFKSLTLE